MAKPKDANGSASEPRAFAINRTPVITLARNTDGEGRTRKMKPIRTSAVRIRRARLLRKIHCVSQSMVAAMIAKFSPLTAVKCVSPTRRISVVNCALSREVSPRTNPGMRAPLSPAIDWESSENLCRIPVVACINVLACEIGVGCPLRITRARTFRSFDASNFPSPTKTFPGIRVVLPRTITRIGARILHFTPEA